MKVRRPSQAPRSRGDRARWLRIGVIAAAIGAITFVSGYLVAVRVLFPPLPEPENGIVVPSFLGMSVPVAEARARQLGLRVTESTQLAHPTQPPGIVIAQDPLPGQQLRQMGAIRLGVSSGLPRLPLPNVIGFMVDRARAALAAVGFAADESAEENEAPAGTVIRMLPPGGSEQPVPSRIMLIVSSGPPPAPDTLVAPPDTVPLSRTNE